MARKVQRRTRKPQMGDILKMLAGKSRLARPMSAVDDFVSFPTIFRSFNRATTIGGAPLGCTWLVHGPPAAGKTAFLIGLIKSVQALGGISAFFDIELSAETKRWFAAMGLDGSKCLYYGRTSSSEEKKPITYEEIVEEADSLLENFQKLKAAGNIAPGTPLLIVLDSISKLAPESLMKNLRGKDGGDALKAGVGRQQAQMNAAWLIALGPRIGDDDIIFAIIAHETVKQGAGTSKWTQDFNVRGGDALIFETMMQVRVTFGGLVADLAKEKEDDRVPMVGKRHNFQILKNKHGPSHQRGVLYTATGGGLCPPGFDTRRELLHEAIYREIVQGPDPSKMTLGSRFEYGKHKFTLKDCYTNSEKADPILMAIDDELGAPAGR